MEGVQATQNDYLDEIYKESQQTIAYSYLRLSSARQIMGDGQRRQMEATIAAAKKHGWTLSKKTFNDLGVSAFKGDNAITGALGAFLRLVEDGEIERGSVLMVENPDRISREGVTKSVSILMNLLSSGIMVYTTADGGKLYTGEGRDAFMDLITWGIAAERAHNESVVKSDRIRKAKKTQMETARETGQAFSTRHTPYWLKAVKGKDKKVTFEEIPERVEMMRKIVDMRLNGWGTTMIINELSRQGYSPDSFKKDGKVHKQKAFSKTTIQRWLTKGALAGYFQPTKMVDGKRVPAGDPIPDYFPRIISDETQRRLRGTFGEVRKGRTAPAPDANLFKGLVVCECTGRVHYTRKSGHVSKHKVKGKELIKWYKRLRCENRRFDLCDMPFVSYSHFEGIILQALSYLNWEGVINTKASERSQRLSELKTTILTKKDLLDTLDVQIGNLVDVLQASASNPHILDRLNTLTKERDEIQVEVDELGREYSALRLESEDNDVQARETATTISNDLYRGSQEARMKAMNLISQYVSKIVVAPTMERIKIYDSNDSLMADIRSDIDLEVAHIKLPNGLEWEYSQKLPSVDEIEERHVGKG